MTKLTVYQDGGERRLTAAELRHSANGTLVQA